MLPPKIMSSVYSNYIDFVLPVVVHMGYQPAVTSNIPNMNENVHHPESAMESSPVPISNQVNNVDNPAYNMESDEVNMMPSALALSSNQVKKAPDPAYSELPPPLCSGAMECDEIYMYNAFLTTDNGKKAPDPAYDHLPCNSKGVTQDLIFDELNIKSNDQVLTTEQVKKESNQGSQDSIVTSL